MRLSTLPLKSSLNFVGAIVHCILFISCLLSHKIFLSKQYESGTQTVLGRKMGPVKLAKQQNGKKFGQVSKTAK